MPEADQQPTTTDEKPPEKESKKDVLSTPQIEAREMDQLINKGLQAHNLVGFLSFLGVILLGLGVLYFKRDRMLEEQPYQSKLELMVKNQADKDMRAYRLEESEVYLPQWPTKFYQKIRTDIFIVAGLALLLAAVFIHIEKAKLRRNDVLVYRALAREIEKLRLKIKKLEGRKAKDSA